MKKRILIVPSWYPEVGKPHIGVFFQEQAQLAAESYDVRVMVLRSEPVGRRKVLSWLHHWAFGPQVTASLTAATTNEPTAVRMKVKYASGTGEPLLQEDTIAQAIQHLTADGWHPELIHAHCAIRGGQIAQALALRLGIPYVVTEHQHLIFDYFTNQDWELAKSVYRRAARLAVVSEFERQMLLMNGVDRPMEVVGNLIDDQQFQLSPPADESNAKEVLFIGTTSRLKDHHTFFRAMKLVKEATRQPFKITVVSPEFQSGDSRRLVSEVADHGLTDAVEFVASANRSEMAKLLHRCTVFVSTSIAETFGVAVCEALMCGKPVVVTASGGIHDFVRHGENGFVSPIGDEAGLAKQIEQVLSGALAPRPDQVRNSVVDHYGRAAFAERLNHLYA